MASPNFVDKTVWTGDNLYILRGLNSECIDLIYLDPPFNSNRDYEAPVGSKSAGAAFKDTWTLSDLDVAWMGLISDEQPSIANLLHTAGLTHGKGMQSYPTMMSVRLLEMRRVMKDTGSIYLHCDPTASHYLKVLMDAVFGPGNFRNKIIWKRSHPKGLAFTRFASNHDVILAYGSDRDVTWNPAYSSNPRANEQYSLLEEGTGRRYQLTSLLNPNPNRPNLTYEFKGVTKVWRWTKERMEKTDRDGLIVVPRDGKGVPRLKRYLDEQEGIPVGDTWDDIPIALGKERIGYPTQKPLALLERIIAASSNPGDVVLDPFCGCATACVAAENLSRQWVGIDLSEKAVELVNMRLQQTMGSLFHNRLVTVRTDIPRRTDIDAPIHYRKNAHVLYGRQEGECAGCKIWLPFRNFTIDHIVPQNRGGTNHLDNLQMLCGACNSLKGDRPQEYLVARLQEAGIL